MIVYGGIMLWGVMHYETKKIICVAANEFQARIISDLFCSSFSENFGAIELNDFEKKYCEPIK